MKSLLILILILFSLKSRSQDFLSHYDLKSTYKLLKDSTAGGTCFRISYKNKNYWITAKHIFPNIKNKDSISLYIDNDNKIDTIKGKAYIDNNPDIDIIVIKPRDSSNISSIVLNPIGPIIGSNGYFLGYPFLKFYTKDESKINNGFPFPFVKQCILSGTSTNNEKIIYYLDGINNPGFSGGPVLFQDYSKDRKFYLLGVISGYTSFRQKIKDPNGQTVEYTIDENTGIIISYGNQHIHHIINNNSL